MPTYPSLRGIIFDMDGVLVDSEPFIKEAARRMFEQVHQTAVLPDDFLPFVGTGEDRFLGGVAEKYGVTLNMPADKTTTYDIYLDIIKGRLHALPGAIDYVAKSRARGLTLAVATSADRRKAEGNLREIGLPQSAFDAIVTGTGVRRKKPDPEIFLLAAARLNLSPAECLVVEDAFNGVTAARAAGCRCLAVATTFPAAALAKLHPDYLAADLSVAPHID
jgi:beta-phosphoglucomutase